MLIFQYLIIYGRINKEVRIITCISNTSYMASDDVNLSFLTTFFFWENSFARYAVVTGANKGLGWGIVKQLASKGVMVVLTARDETRGLEAVEKLNESGLSDHVVFHLLDVMDPASIASLADFIRIQYGKLDILVRPRFTQNLWC
jgi:predicted amino acid dehydrogenase